MLADRAMFGLANGGFKAGLRGLGRATGKTIKEFERALDRPADINAGENVIAVRGEHLVELIFEAMDALVEAIDLLDGQRPLEIQTWLGNRRGRGLREGGDEHHFGLPHLESEEQQEENDQE